MTASLSIVHVVDSLEFGGLERVVTDLAIAQHQQADGRDPIEVLAAAALVVTLPLAQPEPPANRDELALTRALLRNQAQRQSRYVCAHCGFKARQYNWQCPGCNRWESCAPQRAEELERA